MPDRSFEHTIGFYEVQTPNGLVVLPLITVTLVQPSGTRVDLPLMFDTGASVTTLRPLLGFRRTSPVGDCRGCNPLLSV